MEDFDRLPPDLRRWLAQALERAFGGAHLAESRSGRRCGRTLQPA
jgi:hypothetical protein